MTDPRPAADLVRDLMRAIGSSKARRAHREALEDILGPDLAAHCEILVCRAGRLVVEVDSAPLFAELSGFRREAIRQRLNELVPAQPIAQLTFRLGGTGHA